MTQRITWIDLAKGLTILLVVLGHVIIGLFDANLYTGTTQTYLLASIQSIYLFHMPVFFALSGYFFTPVNTLAELGTRIKKRCVTIGIPYTAFSLILFVLSQLGGSKVRSVYDLQALLHIWQAPIGPLWFLYVLFIVIVANSLLSLWIKDIRIHLVLAITVALLANFLVTPVYAIQRLLIWSPFFLLGAYLRQYPIKTTWQRYTSLIAIYISYIIIWISLVPTSRVSYNVPGLDGLVMIIAIVIAFMVFQKIDPTTVTGHCLEAFGQRSLGIYLVHVPLVSASRILLLQFGLTNVLLQIFVGFIVGWFGTLMILKYVSPINYILYPADYLPCQATKKTELPNK